jgi:hypothetical protein
LQAGKIDRDLLAEVARAVAEGLELIEGHEQGLAAGLTEASIAHETLATDGRQFRNRLQSAGSGLPVEGDDLSRFHTTRKNTANDHGELSGPPIVLNLLSR